MAYCRINDCSDVYLYHNITTNGWSLNLRGGSGYELQTIDDVKSKLLELKKNGFMIEQEVFDQIEYEMKKVK